MPFTANLTIQDPRLFRETFAQLDGGCFELENIHYLHGDEFQYVLFGWLSECEYSEFTRALEQDTSVTEYQQLTDNEGRHLYRVDLMFEGTERSFVFPLCCMLNIIEIESKRDSNGLHLHAWFPSQDELREFNTAVEETAGRVLVNRLSFGQPDEFTDGQLTSKQQEALSLAIRRGYFESPSQITLDELAEELDVTPQTVSRHIRVSVRKLVENTLPHHRETVQD